MTVKIHCPRALVASQSRTDRPWLIFVTLNFILSLHMWESFTSALLHYSPAGHYGQHHGKLFSYLHEQKGICFISSYSPFSSQGDYLLCKNDLRTIFKVHFYMFRHNHYVWTQFINDIIAGLAVCLFWSLLCSCRARASCRDPQGFPS